MMQKRVGFITVFFAASALLGPAFPGGAKPTKTVPTAQRELQAVYAQIDAALAQKDVDAVADFDADDCEYYNTKGKLLEEGSGRQELVDLLEYVDTIHSTDVITSFSGSDTDATVTVKEHIVARAANSINGRAIRGVADEVSRDYWVKTDDGWKRKRTREVSIKGSLHKNF